MLGAVRRTTRGARVVHWLSWNPAKPWVRTQGGSLASPISQHLPTSHDVSVGYPLRVLFAFDRNTPDSSSVGFEIGELCVDVAVSTASATGATGDAIDATVCRRKQGRRMSVDGCFVAYRTCWLENSKLHNVHRLSVSIAHVSTDEEGRKPKME